MISQTPIAMPSIAASVIVPLMGRKNERKERNSWRNLTGLEPDNEIWPGDDQSFDAVLRRLAAYKRVVVLSGEVHWGSTAQISYWKRGPKRLDLASALRAELDADGTTIGAGLRAAFTAAGLTLTDQACRVKRAGNEEWLLSTRRPRRCSSSAPRPTGSTSTTRTCRPGWRSSSPAGSRTSRR